jgi:crotonobetainyl-CoA:carnitine CoA-transferase CaiB-like acyl-CoA transferase
MKSAPGQPPVVCPMGGVSDIGAGLFATVGLMAALWERNTTGRGQHVDVAMLDTTVAITDIVTNYWSMGLRQGEIGATIMHAFAASDGFFVVQAGREEQFRRLATTIGHPEWLTDPRLSSRQGWVEHLETVIRPDLEAWSAGRTRAQACAELSTNGVVAGACLTAEEVVADEHIRRRDVLARFPVPGDDAPPVLTPGSPIRLSEHPHQHGSHPPYLGEHTRGVLTELGLGPGDIDNLVSQGIVVP